MIKRIKSDGWTKGEHLLCNVPFVLDVRSHDIPQTIRRMIKSLPKKCVAISLRTSGGANMVAWAESQARRRNIRILWIYKSQQK